jgi:hypothetical protein
VKHAGVNTQLHEGTRSGERRVIWLAHPQRERTHDRSPGMVINETLSLGDASDLR